MTGTIIKILRIKADMSQDELAKRSGYNDRSSIAKIEAGKVDLPESKIKLFAEIFSVTPAAIMGMEPIDTSYSSKMLIPPGKSEILSEDELELVEKYKQLTEINKGRVLQQIDTLLDAQTKGEANYTISVG